mmetsp:Transcript_27521/g.80687  ORF Transcript_27521/g.80687 Transcript_27521/m.80687 type:complete len:444 (-) Transcript_27521:429-1760(-)
MARAARASRGEQMALGGRADIGRQRRGQRAAGGALSCEVHRDGELVGVERAVAVDVGEVPHLPQHVDRQLRPLKDRPHRLPARLAAGRSERAEDLVVPRLVLGRHAPRDGGRGRGAVRVAAHLLRGALRRRRRRRLLLRWRRRVCDLLRRRRRRSHVRLDVGQRAPDRGVGVRDSALLRELRHQLGDLVREDVLHRRDCLCVELWELGEVVPLHDGPELGDVGEVSHREGVCAVHLEEVLLDVREQLRLRLLRPEVGGHLLLEVAHDVRVRLSEPHALDELVDLADGRVLWHVLEVGEQVAHLHLEELARPLRPAQRLVPEGADVDAHALGRLDDLAQRPHQRAVDAQQLLAVDGVRLVEHDADLVVVPLERLDRLLELVRDVQLVRVKEEENHVGARGEPGAHLGEGVRPPNALLLARQYAGRVDEGHVVKERRVKLGALEL